MLTYHLDHTAKMPLYEQLYRAIRADIMNGVLAGGTRLPAKRPLAEHLKVSQITVETAYGQLTAEGYLRAVPRSGYFVQQLDALPRTACAQAAPEKQQEKTEQTADFDFKTNVVDTDCFPFSTWAKLSRAVLTDYDRSLLLAAAPQGVPALREQIRQYLYAFRGISVDTDQIVVGAGSEYLVTLLIQLLGRTRTYAIETPGYPKLTQIFRANDAETAPIPLDNEGLSMEALRQSAASVAYLTPSHHFPLGIVTPAARRASLLRWASEGEDRYLIEDDYDSEFRFTSRPIPALKELDHEDRVIYLNTFAKSLAPSLRIGYLVLPRRLLPAYQAKFGGYASTVPVFEQYTLARFLETGSFERHVNRIRIQYKARLESLLDALAQSELRGMYTVSGAEAGLHILLHVENGMDEGELIASAAKQGVRVYGLSGYYVDTAVACPPATVILGYAGIPSEKLPDAVSALGKAWKNKTAPFSRPQA